MAVDSCRRLYNNAPFNNTVTFQRAEKWRERINLQKERERTSTGSGREERPLEDEQFSAGAGERAGKNWSVADRFMKIRRRFPGSCRIHDSREFQRIYRWGKLYRGRRIKLFVLVEDNNLPARAGFSTVRGMNKAVWRWGRYSDLTGTAFPAEWS